MNVQVDISDCVAALKHVGADMYKSRKMILELAAWPLQESVKRAAPVSKKSHFRYKGGKVFAEYTPGNLKRSFRRMTFPRAKSKLFVGAKLDKGTPGGVYRGNKIDGYYLNMVETKRPFWVPVVQANEGKVIGAMMAAFRMELEKHNNRV